MSCNTEIYVGTSSKIGLGINQYLRMSLLDLINNMTIPLLPPLPMAWSPRKSSMVYRFPTPRPPTFYSLPKTHKSLTHPPGRLIVSGVGSKTERASKFVDEYLHPHVITLPSYIKDTSDLLWNLDGLTVPLGCSLVAIDIEAFIHLSHMTMA